MKRVKKSYKYIYQSSLYMKTHFITFGAGEQNYYDAVDRLETQAININLFDTITTYTDKDLQTDGNFWTKHGDFIQSNRRGYGYWLWKPYLIKKTMAALEDGDVLLYLDCGCEIDVRNRDWLQSLFERVKKCDMIVTTTENEERHWNKMDLPVYLNVTDDAHLQSGQHQAGAVLIHVCDKTRRFLHEWYETCCNYSLIDDSPSISPNFYRFSEHRHDQAVFSLLLKKYNMCNGQDSLWNCIRYNRNKSGVSEL
jgi:hypothetical protein